MVHADGARHGHLAKFQPLGILLFLSPLIAVLTTAILLGLLGIFVTWLLVVASLLAAIVALDVARRSMRRLPVTALGAPRQRAIGYPGH